MTTIVTLTRLGVREQVSYPDGFTHATCVCNSCRFRHGQYVVRDSGKELGIGPRPDNHDAAIEVAAALALLYPKMSADEIIARLQVVGYGDRCAHATRAMVLAVGFILSDGRMGAVNIQPESDDPTIVQAIAAWSKSNPVSVDKLVGTPF